MYSSNKISVSVDAEVSYDDIKDALTLGEMLNQVYEADTKEILEELDFDSILEFMAQHPQFTQPDTVRALCEDNDFAQAVLDSIKEHQPDLLADVPVKMLELAVTAHSSGLFSTVALLSSPLTLRAVILSGLVDTNVRFTCENGHSLHFNTASEGSALEMIKALIAVHS